MLRIEIALLTLLALWPLTVFAALATLPVTLDASMEQPTHREGQPVMLALTLHNNTAKNLFTASAFEESAFQIAVIDEAGRPVPHTAVGERVLTPPTVVRSNSIRDFSPGQTLSYRFNLARLFDLSRAGVYTVIVSRRFRPWVLPRPAADAPPQEIVLSAGPLTVQMEEDAAAKSGLTSYAPPPSRQPFLYMTGPGGNGVGRYRVGENGSVSFAFPPTYAAPLPPAKDGSHSIIATPDGRFLYVGNGGDSTVSQFRVGENGVLFPLFPATVPAQKFPGLVLMDPHGRFLYALSNWGNTLYAIGQDGRLTLTALMPSEAWAKERIHTVVPSDFGLINPTGNVLYACNGRVCGYQIAPNGTVTSLPPLGDSMTGMDDKGRVNAIASSSDGKFVFAGASTKNGVAFFDQIVTMRVAPDGGLSALPGVTIPTGPPSEWPNQSKPDCAGLAVDPSGHFLVVINPQYLACYWIGPDGSLAPLASKPTGAGYNAVLFGPDSHILYAVDRYADKFTAFRLDDRLGLIPAGVSLPSGLLIADCIGTASAPTPLKWGEAVGGIMVSASLPADVLPADALVVLTVRLKNTTKHSIRLGAADKEMTMFRLSVTGPPRQYRGMSRSGSEPVTSAIPLLAAGHDLLDAPGSSTAPVVLSPGGQRQYRFVLTRLADLTVAGNYTVQTTRTTPNKTVAASPVVPFMVDGPFDGRVRDGKYQVQIL